MYISISHLMQNTILVYINILFHFLYIYYKSTLNEVYVYYMVCVTY